MAESKTQHLQARFVREVHALLHRNYGIALDPKTAEPRFHQDVAQEEFLRHFQLSDPESDGLTGIDPDSDIIFFLDMDGVTINRFKEGVSDKIYAVLKEMKETYPSSETAYRIASARAVLHSDSCTRISEVISEIEKNLGKTVKIVLSTMWREDCTTAHFTNDIFSRYPVIANRIVGKTACYMDIRRSSDELWKDILRYLPGFDRGESEFTLRTERTFEILLWLCLFGGHASTLAGKNLPGQVRYLVLDDDVSDIMTKYLGGNVVQTSMYTLFDEKAKATAYKLVKDS